MQKNTVNFLAYTILASTLVLTQGFLGGSPLFSNDGVAVALTIAEKAAAKAAKKAAKKAAAKAAKSGKRSAITAKKAAKQAEKAAAKAVVPVEIGATKNKDVGNKPAPFSTPTWGPNNCPTYPMC